MTIQKNYFRLNCMDQSELNCFVWKIVKAAMKKKKLPIFK